MFLNISALFGFRTSQFNFPTWFLYTGKCYDPSAITFIITSSDDVSDSDRTKRNRNFTSCYQGNHDSNHLTLHKPSKSSPV